MAKDATAPRWLPWLVPAGLLLAYGRSLSQPLVPSWDDGRFLVDFAPVRSISLAHLRAILTQIHFEAYHPLHLLSYWLDVPWFGPDGPILHGTNLLLFIGAVLLLRRLFERLGLTPGAATLAALVYAMHPVQNEAVTWATGRKEILALLFVTLAFHAHLAADRYEVDRARPSTMLRALLPSALLLCAALSKTTALPFAGVLILADALGIGRDPVPLKTAVLRQLPALFLGAGLAVLVIVVWQGHAMIRPAGSVGLVAFTFSHYVGTALWPAALSPIYPIDRTGDFSLTVWIVPALFAGNLIALRVNPPSPLRDRAIFALTSFGVLLLPVLNLVPVYFQVQDRYLSLPLLPLAFGFGVLLDMAGRRRGVAEAVAVAVVLALGVRSAQYAGVWRSDLRLWSHATATHPGASYAWMKLGEVHRDADRMDASVAAYASAIEAAPGLALPRLAYFNAVTLREERAGGMEERSMLFTARYQRAFGDAEALREVAGSMEREGYREPVMLALAQSFALDPLPDARLARAAEVQLEQGDVWLARFYVSQMAEPPDALRVLLETASAPPRGDGAPGAERPRAP